jgi:hypothetical protein
MLPSNLQPEQFAKYPPQAKKLAVANLKALQQLPLSFLPGLLRELMDYDFKFPAERTAIEKELATLSSLSREQLNQWFQAFFKLALYPKLENMDWINRPAQFLEQESAYLWTTHQLDAFRRAATDYGDRLRSTLPTEHISVPRLGIAVIGQGVTSYDGPLFRRLRKQGTYFGRVKPDNGLELLLMAVAARAKAHPVPYGHWYIDGGQTANHDSSITCVQYQGLEPVRSALLKYMQTQIERPGMGPEELRTNLAQLLPSDLGMDTAGDPVLDRFQVRLFTEGSGTQIFSTTFAQWAAREALRRAQPLTLIVRFAPRQKQRPMNELLSGSLGNLEFDFTGSLIDADMGAYYQWINQQRLVGSEESSFVVWFENHSQALAIGPSFPRNAESDSTIDLGELLSLAIT